jgi:PAS domain-containing protein
MESALDARRAELEYVLETMAEGLTIVDRDGVFVRVNAGCRGDLRVQRSRSSECTSGTCPGSASSSRGCLRPVADAVPAPPGGEQSIRGLEYEIVPADGTRVPVAAQRRAAEDDTHGAFAGAVATYVDISQRRQAEEAVRRYEQITAATVSTALDAIITVDHQGNVIEFNPAAEACFRHARSADPRQADGRAARPAAAAHAPSRGLPALPRETRSRGPRPAPGDARDARRRRGDRDRALDHGATRPRAAGLHGVRARHHQKKHAEQLAREAQERLDRALDASNIALFEVDLTTSKVYLSESWSLMRASRAAPTETTIAALLEQAIPTSASSSGTRR